MVDNKLNFNTGSGQPGASNKMVRMHVMPEDIFSEDELHRKINKLPPKKKEAPRKELEVPVIEPKKEKAVQPAEEVVETFIPSGLKRPTKQNKMKSSSIAIIIVLVLLVLGGGGGAAWYFYTENQKAQIDRNLDLIEGQGDLQDNLADEEAKKAAEEAAKAEEEKKARLVRDNQRILDIIDMQKALKSYYQAEEKYPISLPNDEWKIGETVYLAEVPVDPINESDYRYIYNSIGGENYSITFMMEEGINGLSAGIHSIANTEILTINGQIQKVAIEEDTDFTQPIALASSRDTDLDGVTDLEEFMYGTNPQLFDSDDDTYTDHQEILNLYAPSGMAPQTLLDVGLVKEYSSEKQDYRIYYPSTWRLQALDVNEEEIMFVSDQTEEYITVTIEENVGELSLAQWIKIKMLDVKVNYEAEYYQEEFVTKNGVVQGLWLPELFMIFFEKENKIYSVAYHFDGLKQLSYQTTFEMMAKSFRLGSTMMAEETSEEEEAALVEGESTGDEVLDYEESNDMPESEFIEEDIANELEENAIEEVVPVEEEMSGEEAAAIEGSDGELDTTLDEFYAEEEVLAESEESDTMEEGTEETVIE